MLSPAKLWLEPAFQLITTETKSHNHFCVQDTNKFIWAVFFFLVHSNCIVKKLHHLTCQMGNDLCNTVRVSAVLGKVKTGIKETCQWVIPRTGINLDNMPPMPAFPTGNSSMNTYVNHWTMVCTLSNASH